VPVHGVWPVANATLFEPTAPAQERLRGGLVLTCYAQSPVPGVEITALTVNEGAALFLTCPQQRLNASATRKRYVIRRLP